MSENSFEPEGATTARDGRPWVLALSGPSTAGEERVLCCGEQCTIGSGAGVDVRVDDAQLGAEHVRVVAGPNAVTVYCLDSRAGMYVGSFRLDRAELSGSDGSFVVGQTAVCVSRLAAPDEELSSGPPIAGLVGSSTAIRRLSAQIRRWAPLSAPVLLQGESGTGKDVVARALHEVSGRTGRYVAINVGALTDNLADAELFGHRRGAFTGAVGTRVGVFEEASGGTLFLDEVADLSPAVQIKLLRVIEDRRLRPLGSNQEIPVNARVVSASWASLADRVQQGRFRGDLFHRVSTITLKVPALRQRKGDIAALSQHLLLRYRAELGEKRLTAAALSCLLAYHWPGNVRELGAVLYRAAASAPGVEIDERLVSTAVPGGPRKAERTLNAAEAAQMLSAHQGNVSAAARAARIPRTTFRALLARSGTPQADAPEAAEPKSVRSASHP
jgi:DNA-binding NtrC family response regulator